MNARLSSLLVAGGVVLAGIQSGSLKGALPDAGSPATSVTLDGASMLPGDAQVLKLSIPGFSGVPIVQVLDHPQRIVVDLPGVNRGTKVGKGALKGLGCPQILRSRMAQFAVSPQPVTRLVLEVAKGTRAEVSSDATGVSIRLNAAGGAVIAQMVPRTPLASPSATATPVPSPAVAMTSPAPAPVSGTDQPAPVQVAQATLPETVAPVVTMAAPSPVATPDAAAPAPKAVEPAPAPKAVEPAPAPKAVEPAPAPKAVEPAPAPVPEPVAEAPKASPETAKSAPAAPAKAPLAPVPATGTTFQALPALAVPSVLPTAVAQDRPAPRTEAHTSRTLGESSTHYTGAKITVDVPGADLQTFLRIIAETAHLNLIADTDVQGVYAFKFVNTPWDQVLDVILKHVGLGKEISNGVIRVAKIERLQKEEEDRKKLEDAKALAGDLQSITCPLSFAKATEAKNILDKVITKRGSIIIDERTNTLIISDLPRNFPLLYDLIAQLDVKIQQVQIEARVVEASKNWERDFGAKWPTSNSGDAKLTVGGSDAAWGSTGGPSWNSVNNLPSSGGNAAIASYSGGAEGVTTISNPAGQLWVSLLSNRMSVNVILQALEKDGVVKVVSSPKVVTQNNKKAKVLSGSKIPYPATQAGNNAGAISVQFAEANLELDVTPQITNDGTIIMDIRVEKSDADFGHLVGTTPTITHKEVETQVLVKDGGTAIMGGVYKNNNTEQSTGVPFLNKLPLIGFLFRNKVHQDSNDELLIFITPRILNN